MPVRIILSNSTHYSGPSLAEFSSIERFQRKSESILKIFYETGNDWEETFYRILARYFGFRVNTEPFEMLATALPLRIIRKHADNWFQIEALLIRNGSVYWTRDFLRKQFLMSITEIC